MGGGVVPRFLGEWFVKWFVKPLGVLTRTLFVHVLLQLGVPGRVMIVCVMQHHMTSRCMGLSPHLVGRVLGDLENWNGEERRVVGEGVGELGLGGRVCSIASNANGMVQAGLNNFEVSGKE